MPGLSPRTWAICLLSYQPRQTTSTTVTEPGSLWSQRHRDQLDVDRLPVLRRTLEHLTRPLRQLDKQPEFGRGKERAFASPCSPSIAVSSRRSSTAHPVSSRMRRPTAALYENATSSRRLDQLNRPDSAAYDCAACYEAGRTSMSNSLPSGSAMQRHWKPSSSRVFPGSSQRPPRFSISAVA